MNTCCPGESIQELDPSANFPLHCRFDCHYHEDGITVSLPTRQEGGLTAAIKRSEYDGDDRRLFCMRVYNPKVEVHVVPDFNSTTYCMST